MIQHGYRPSSVMISRYYDAEHEVLIATGDCSGLNDAYLDHARRWGEVPDPLLSLMMQQALVAAALHLSCRPRDEIVGWTLIMEKPLLYLFVTGDAEKGTVIGRVRSTPAKETGGPRLYVQTQRTGQELRQSVVEAKSLDVLEIFEDYYAESEQNAARFFDYEDGRFTMVMSLPGVDKQWLSLLTRESTQEHIDKGELKDLDEREFKYQCGCSPGKMRNVILSVYDGKLEDLFEDDSHVEVTCPRCGHEWELHRADLE